MKSRSTSLALCLLFLSVQFISADESKAESLEIKALPLPASVRESFLQKERTAHVLVDPKYRIWDRSVIRWQDGRYHAYYSRWKGVHWGWLYDSEVVHAVSDKPEGPFEVTGVVLRNRNTDGWDLVDAHSQFALTVEDKVLIYYQSLDLRGKFPKHGDSPFPDRSWLKNKQNRNTMLFSQRLGLAVSDDPAGPFERTGKPVITPEDGKRLSRITDNPAVVYQDGRYLLILKSDDATREKRYRFQAVAHSSNAEGPFHVVDEPLYIEKQTEDATAWFDKLSRHYYVACHVFGRQDLAMFTSTDGLTWQPASQPVLMKKEFVLSDGTRWKPQRVEQPRILTDDTGTPIMLYVAVADQGVNGNIAVPLVCSRKERKNEAPAGIEKRSDPVGTAEKQVVSKKT